MHYDYDGVDQILAEILARAFTNRPPDLDRPNKPAILKVNRWVVRAVVLILFLLAAIALLILAFYTVLWIWG